MKKQFILLILTAWSAFLMAQITGCTDSNATNFNENATVNDGSCIYDPLVLDPVIAISELPSMIEETSGLIWFREAYWTHNDSGGAAAIYKIDPATGQVIQTIGIANGTNVDMEDITQDDEYIYVGDIGNNHGNRDDLVIYKIKKSDIPLQGDVEVQAEKIAYSYNDQTSFERKNRRNDYDCESLVAIGDHLYLFTKNWANEETRCYKAPKTPGEYGLDVYAGFNVRGLLTAADYQIENHTLLLLGYENFVPFMWVMWDFNGDDFFGGNKKRVDFAYIQGAQTEGVCFVNQEDIAISCEKSYFPPRLYKIQLNQITAKLNSPQEGFTPFQMTLYPNPAEKQVQMKIDGLTSSKFDVEIYNLSWQKVNQFSFKENNYQSTVSVKIPTNDLKKGIYFVRLKEGKRVGFRKLIIR